MRSASTVFVFRLKPHEDLKKSILKFARDNNIEAGIVLSCVGSVEQYNLRFANQKSGDKQKGHFEIISCVGTFSAAAAHLHLSVADHTGKTTSGHMLEENLVYTTAEIAVAELTELTFDRAVDPEYGFYELLVKEKKSYDP